MIKLILNILVKAIKVGIKLDSNIKTDFDCLPNNYIIKINILPKNQNICVMCLDGKLTVLKQAPQKVDLLIEFKDEKTATKCLLGQMSVANAFCEHRIKVFGNINNAMALTRIINTIECYLFPKFIYGKLFEPIPELKSNKFKFYLNLLFGGNQQWNILNF